MNLDIFPNSLILIIVDFFLSFLPQTSFNCWKQRLF